MLKRSVFFPQCLLLLMFLTGAIVAMDGGLDPFWMSGRGFNDDVLDMAMQPDGKLVIVGEFDNPVGVPSRKIVRLGTDGNIDSSFNSGSGANATIFSVNLLADGKILVGGDFTSYNGMPAMKLARLNPDGSLDLTFMGGSGFTTSSSVRQIKMLPDNRILVTGQFAEFSGFPANSVLRLLSDGTIDPSFSSPTILTPLEPIHTVSVQPNGQVLIGGRFFNSSTGQNRNIARLQSNGSLDTSFQANADSGIFSAIRSIVIRADGKIYVGGGFSSINGSSRLGIALLNTNGTLDSSFVSSGITSVSNISIQNDGKLVLAGIFPQPEGLNWTVTRLNSTGTTDDGFIRDELDPVNSVIITAAGQILICGYMRQTSTTVGGANRPGVRRLNADGSRDNSYLTRTGAAEFYIERMSPQTNGKILIFGQFREVGGLVRIRFAQLNSNGTVDENFNPSITPTVGVTLPDGKIIVAGEQFSVTGIHPIRRLNSDGSIDSTFVASTTTTGSGLANVADIAIQPDGKILLVGGFESINGVPRKAIARLNPDGSIDNTFTTNLVFNIGTINRIKLRPDGKMWIAGVIENAHGILKLDQNGIFEHSSPAGNLVTDISIQKNGQLLVAGLFLQVSNFPSNYVARLNENGQPDSTFLAPTITGSGTIVRTVSEGSNGAVMIGGEFSNVGGVTRRGFARLKRDGSLDTAFNIEFGGGPSPNLYSIVKQSDNKILFGGNFTQVNGVGRSYSSRHTTIGPSKHADFDGDGKTDVSIFRPNGGSGGGEWWYLRSSDGGNRAFAFGEATDDAVPADYTGDGKTDIAFWRPASSEWFILRSEDSTFYAFPFGAAGDVPMPADFDGDGKADQTVFRPSTNTWFTYRSSDGQVTTTPFGVAGDLPVAADYDGDGKADIAIYRPNGGSGGGEWWYLRSSDGANRAYAFGTSNDRAVPGDYTGDGKADLAFWRPSSGDWFVLRSEDDTFYSFPFGISTDVPVPGDYDGDGKADAAVFRPSNNTWYLLQSTAGVAAVTFGANGDQPLPNSYVR